MLLHPATLQAFVAERTALLHRMAAVGAHAQGRPEHPAPPPIEAPAAHRSDDRQVTAPTLFGIGDRRIGSIAP